PAGRHLAVPAGGRAVRRRRPARLADHQLPDRPIDRRARQRVFGTLMVEQRHDGVPSQPAYEPFAAVRGDAPAGPPVALLGVACHEDDPSADEVRRQEAADVAAVVRTALEEGWLVDRSNGGPVPDWQPARAGDSTILVPTRTALPALDR